MATYTSKHLTFKQIFDEASRLSAQDQRRLREELTKLTGVKLVRPSHSAAAIRNGRLLADEVRKELQATAAQSLDTLMDDISRKAQERGLTPEIWESILNGPNHDLYATKK